MMAFHGRALARLQGGVLMKQFGLARCCSVVLVTWIGAAPAWALDVKPGLWEITVEGLAEAQQACLTQELLDADISDMQMPEGVECQNEIKEETAKLTISHTVCTGAFAIEGDTRIDVLSPESMTMQSASVMNLGGGEQTITTSAQYRWLSSDCGDVVPVELGKSVE
jgi:hypothetical protein